MSSATKTNPGRTNQKLYFAKLQQELLEQALVSDDFDAEPKALACREAVIFHLEGALVSFLHELCRFYKLPALDNTEALRVAMQAKGQVSPEVSLLQQWEQSTSSWLANLHAAYAAIQASAEAVKAEPEPEEEAEVSSSQRISEIRLVATQSDLPLSEPDVANLKMWHQSLTQAIRDFRSEMQEW